MFDEEVALLDLETTNSTDTLSALADALYQKGVVKDTYKAAVIDREEHFATGLLGEYVGVAIPHTDPEHVNKAQIAFARLKEPVHFKQMGDEADVPAKLIFMLALKEAHAQLETLQKLMGILQDQAIINQLLAAKTTADVVKAFQNADLI